MVEGSGQQQYAPAYCASPQQKLVLIIAVEGEGERRVPVSEQPCYIIGRNPSLCDIPVEIRTASRVHCCLAHDPEGNVHLVDLNSGHGETLAALCVCHLCCWPPHMHLPISSGRCITSFLQA